MKCEEKYDEEKKTQQCDEKEGKRIAKGNCNNGKFMFAIRP